MMPKRRRRKNCTRWLRPRSCLRWRKRRNYTIWPCGSCSFSRSGTNICRPTSWKFCLHTFSTNTVFGMVIDWQLLYYIILSGVDTKCVWKILTRIVRWWTLLRHEMRANELGGFSETTCIREFFDISKISYTTQYADHTIINWFD